MKYIMGITTIVPSKNVQFTLDMYYQNIRGLNIKFN